MPSGGLFPNDFLFLSLLAEGSPNSLVLLCLTEAGPRPGGELLRGSLQPFSATRSRSGNKNTSSTPDPAAMGLQQQLLKKHFKSQQMPRCLGNRLQTFHRP